MKKNVLNSLLALSFVVIALGAKAQGSWLAEATQASIPAATEMGFGIANLQSMHTDGAGVIGKDDPTIVGAFTNGGIIQGSTNGMYYAFAPASDGTIIVGTKFGAKTFYAYESDAADLATLGAEGNIVTGLTGTPLTCNLVDPDGNATTLTNGETAVSSPDHYTVSFAVTGGKFYAIGVAGSKYMFKGVIYEAGRGTGISDLTELSGVSISSYNNNAIIAFTKNYNNAVIEILSVDGRAVAKQVAASAFETINIENSGIYIVKVTQDGMIKTGKVIVK